MSALGGRGSGLEVTPLDVLGTVAVRLIDLEHQAVLIRGGQRPVDPEATAGGEVDGQQSDRLTGREAVERVVRGGCGAYMQGGCRDDVEDAGGSGQR
ncbi:hypothetical protein Snoj_42380 [Streptomyces nojiriensis]|uniref:Uncharacterized protein n=1 Tax=Streptomyces nojiriensis TaxID=66374 RepID=A0ABQ3SRB0_9ACTN|nr:hypothetical protein GCM10010205_11040 [Streptomyces nojiriensis]GHI70320.1 hypothetical protein Snoj_42380 [Streptomyces nojiriensis]